jgi:hypothetical protein
LKIKLQDPTISYNLEESSFKIQKLNDAFLMKFGIVWGHSNFKSTVLSMIYAMLVREYLNGQKMKPGDDGHGQVLQTPDP